MAFARAVVLSKGSRPARAKMIALNRDDPAALDKRFSDLKPALAAAVKDHSAL
jgi:uncharacterized oxidoreductase